MFLRFALVLALWAPASSLFAQDAPPASPDTAAASPGSVQAAPPTAQAAPDQAQDVPDQAQDVPDQAQDTSTPTPAAPARQTVTLEAPAAAAQPQPPPSYATPQPAPTPQRAAPLPVLGEEEAEDPRRNGVHFSVLGLVGRFRLNYERFLSKHHGLVVEAIYAPFIATGFSFMAGGGGLGYRYHWSGFEKGFVGAQVSFEAGSGERPVSFDGEQEWSGSGQTLSVVVNAGRRWVWDSGFTMVLRGGAGFAHNWVEHDAGNDPEVVETVEDAVPLTLEAEFSLGYSF